MKSYLKILVLALVVGVMWAVPWGYARYYNRSNGFGPAENQVLDGLSLNTVAANTISSGKILVGASALEASFPYAQSISTKATSGITDTTTQVGLVGESAAVGTSPSVGLEGLAKTAAPTGAWAAGVYGRAGVAATGNTNTAYGGYFLSSGTHAGGTNTAVYANAGSGNTNYSFYGAGGTLYQASTSTFGGTVTFNAVIKLATKAADPCDSGTPANTAGVIFYTAAGNGFPCYCNDSGVDLYVHDNSACSYP